MRRRYLWDLHPTCKVVGIELEPIQPRRAAMTDSNLEACRAEITRAWANTNKPIGLPATALGRHSGRAKLIRS